MCLGIPAKIVKIEQDGGEVEFGGIIKDASFKLIDNYRVGDYVLLHAGFAIQMIDEDKAEETLRLLEKIKDEMG